jgi:hypothetical protein
MPEVAEPDEGAVLALRARLLVEPAPAPPAREALAAAAVVTAALSSSASAVEAALCALAYLALPAENRESVAAALEEFGCDLSVSRASTDNARAALLMLVLRLAPRGAHGVPELSASDLLDLSPRRELGGAVECIVALLRARPPRHQADDAAELQAWCAKALWSLTLPEVLQQASNGDTNATSLIVLTESYATHVDSLVRLVISSPVLESAAAAVRPWVLAHTLLRKRGAGAAAGGATMASLAAATELASASAKSGYLTSSDVYSGAATASDLDPAWHAFCGFFLRFTHNLLLFSTASQSDLREHMVGVVASVVLPYVSLATVAIAGLADDLRRASLLMSLSSALSVVAVACFKVRVLRPALRDGSLVASALAVPSVAAHIPCLAALLSLCVNADVLLATASSSSGAGAVTVNHALEEQLLAKVAALDANDRARLQRRLRNSSEHALPTVATGKSFDLLQAAAWPETSLAGGNEAGGGKDADEAPPLCCITRAILTDPVLVVAPSDAIRPVPGVVIRPFRGEGGANDGKSPDGLSVFVCEREAANDSPPEEWVLVELEKDDPLRVAVQRAQVSRLLGEAR